LNEKNSLIISVVGHISIVLLSVLAGLIARDRILPPAPIKVDLLAPAAGTTQTRRTPENKPVEEKKPEIITRAKETPKPTYNPSADLAKLQELLRKHKLEEERRVEAPEHVETSRHHGGIYGSSSAYDSMIQQIVRNNWIQPSRAILGANPPVVLVIIRVDRHGEILSSRITKSSGIPQLDSSVLKAIEDSNPLPEFPPYMAGTTKDFELRFIVED
jgi:colicin import membrane protein